MQDIPKKLRKELQHQTTLAWEAEMRMALEQLATRFDAWRARTLSSADLDAAIHQYHDTTAREIWKRFQLKNSGVPLAHAVATGLLSEESFSPELREHIAPTVAVFRQQDGDA